VLLNGGWEVRDCYRAEGGLTSVVGGRHRGLCCRTVLGADGGIPHRILLSLVCL
jgi:hypothetical protein